MPIYEYRRKTDGSVFEVLQKPGEEPLTKCPTTGVEVEKLISRSSFHLKGDGWYVTDYKDQKAGASKSAPTQSTADQNSETSTEPSASTESKKESSAGSSEGTSDKKEASSSKASKPVDNNKLLKKGEKV